MSGAGTAAKPRLPFCWVCSRKLHGRDSFESAKLTTGEFNEP